MARNAALTGFSRVAVAVMFAAALTSGCTDNRTTPGGADSADRPTSIPTATPTVEASPGTSATPEPGQLCDTIIESANPVLRDVRFGRHDTFDRLAFDFCLPADTTLTATRVKQLTEDGSGAEVTLEGEYFYELTLTPADAHSQSGQPTVPTQIVTVAGGNMQQYKLIGDFEGVVTYGVGFMRLEPTATAIRSDPDDPRHTTFYFDLGPQTG